MAYDLNRLSEIDFEADLKAGPRVAPASFDALIAAYPKLRGKPGSTIYVALENAGRFVAEQAYTCGEVGAIEMSLGSSLYRVKFAKAVSDRRRELDIIIRSQPFADLLKIEGGRFALKLVHWSDRFRMIASSRSWASMTYPPARGLDRTVTYDEELIALA